jgi:hypothetical protein
MTSCTVHRLEVRKHGLVVLLGTSRVVVREKRGGRRIGAHRVCLQEVVLKVVRSSG